MSSGSYATGYSTLKRRDPVEHVALRRCRRSVHRRFAPRDGDEVDAVTILPVELVDDRGLALAVRTPGGEDFEKDRLLRLVQIEEPGRRRHLELRRRLADLGLPDDRRLRRGLALRRSGPRNNRAPRRRESARARDRRKREIAGSRAAQLAVDGERPGRAQATKAPAAASMRSNATCGQSATAESPGPKQPQVAGMCRTTADATAPA